jgi:hypothetical protein
MKTTMNLPIKEIVATIKETPVDKFKSNFTVQLPIFVAVQDCGKCLITLPALGGITISAENKEDVENVSRIAIQGFFDIAQKFGKGLKKELELLGWQLKASRNFKYKTVVKRSQGATSITLDKKSTPSEYTKPEMPVYPQMMVNGYNRTVAYSF